VRRPEGEYYPGTGLALSKAFASYGAVYKSQVWVSTLVNKLAFGTARLPLKVYPGFDGARSEARDTPFAQLLRNPNSRHDPFFFWLWTVSTFEVYGEAMWVKVRPARGRPRRSCGRCTRRTCSPETRRTTPAR
jgi:phage portal protein BeeE